MRQRWEYRVVEKKPNHPLSEWTFQINALGADGWKLVEGSYRFNNGAGSAMMEREKFG